MCVYVVNSQLIYFDTEILEVQKEDRFRRYQGVSTGNKSRLHSCASEMVGGTAGEWFWKAVVPVFESYTDVHKYEN